MLFLGLRRQRLSSSRPPLPKRTSCSSLQNLEKDPPTLHEKTPTVSTLLLLLYPTIYTAVRRAALNCGETALTRGRPRRHRERRHRKSASASHSVPPPPYPRPETLPPLGKAVSFLATGSDKLRFVSSVSRVGGISGERRAGAGTRQARVTSPAQSQVQRTFNTEHDMRIASGFPRWSPSKVSR